MRKLSLSILALSTILAGCKAIDAMDNTDTMNKNLAAMKETTNGMANTTDQMKGSTNELTRLAKVAAGVDAMDLSKHNYSFYLPPPAEILAGAKLFAENATESEMVDYLFATIKEMNEQVPDSNMQDRRLVGGYPADYVNKFNTQQMVRGVVLQAISGQIPQPMVERLIQNQINAGGPRADIVKQMLALRAMFLDGFLIDKDAFRKPIQTIGDARSANEKIGNLKFILGLPFASEISFGISSTSFLPQVNPAQLLPGDADYASKCQGAQQDAACLPTTSDFAGLATYAGNPVDATMDQHWWKKLDRAIEGYTDCKGKQHPGEVNLRGVSSQDAHDFAVIADNAKRNYPAETCPAK